MYPVPLPPPHPIPSIPNANPSISILSPSSALLILLLLFFLSSFTSRCCFLFFSYFTFHTSHPTFSPHSSDLVPLLRLQTSSPSHPSSRCIISTGASLVFCSLWSTPGAVHLHTQTQSDWMNQTQCNGPCCPTSAVPDDLVVPPTPLTTAVKVESHEHEGFLQPTLPESTTPNKIRRRASQGSLRTKPSSVSRFLSKGSVAVHFPSWGHRNASPGSPLRVERTRSPDSRLRLSTTVSRGPRPLSGHLSSWDARQASFRDDCLATLPPTPPDDDSHITWNPQSGMLLFDSHPQPHPGSMPLMDEGPNVGTSPTTGPSDTLSSPSDGLSRGSSSAGTSPGPHDEMDCQQDDGSWLHHGINVTGE